MFHRPVEHGDMSAIKAISLRILWKTNAVVDVVKVDLASSHSGARANDNGGLWPRSPNLGQQLLDQQEVGQVVDAKLRLEAVRRLRVRGHHDARHGDEMVDLGHVVEVLDSPSDIFEVGEVELQEASRDVGVLGLDLCYDGLDAGLGAGG